MYGQFFYMVQNLRQLAVPWTAKESNESIMNRFKWKRCLINIIRYRQLKFLVLNNKS